MTPNPLHVPTTQDEVILHEGVAGIAMTMEMFSDEVERRVAEGLSEGYIEATAEYIEELDYDAEDLKHLISPTLVGKIEAEASKRGMLKAKFRTNDLTGMFA